MNTPKKTEDRTIAARMRTYQAIAAAIRASGDTVAEILNDRYAPASPEGPPAVDYQRVLVDLEGELTATHQEMLGVNTRHEGQLARLVELGNRRDTQADQLFEHFIRVRHSLENIHGGARGFTIVGVTGPTLRDPAGLVKQVRETIDFLESPKVALSGIEGFAVDHSQVALRLTSEADQLDATLADFAEASKDAEGTRLAKNDAIEANDRTFRYVGRAVEGFFHIAGLHDAADRVRPKVRRSGGASSAEEKEPAEGEGESEPSGEESTGESSAGDETSTG